MKVLLLLILLGWGRCQQKNKLWYLL
jgi:hypothetical protein